VARVAAQTGVPERALRAYATAALRLAEQQPGCGLGWNTLAAIGEVESAHGSLNEGTLGPDGRVTPRLLGPVLDGSGELGEIVDSDGGVLDGDATWDRAVGPMQFLPSTWERWGADGDGDGVADVDDLDDAALAAARYLCAAGDLTDASTWIAAVSGYNPGVEYNNAVAQAAQRLADAG